MNLLHMSVSLCVCLCVYRACLCRCSRTQNAQVLFIRRHCQHGIKNGVHWGRWVKRKVEHAVVAKKKKEIKTLL